MIAFFVLSLDHLLKEQRWFLLLWLHFAILRWPSHCLYFRKKGKKVLIHHRLAFNIIRFKIAKQIEVWRGCWVVRTFHRSSNNCWWVIKNVCGLPLFSRSTLTFQHFLCNKRHQFLEFVKSQDVYLCLAWCNEDLTWSLPPFCRYRSHFCIEIPNTFSKHYHLKLLGSFSRASLTFLPFIEMKVKYGENRQFSFPFSTCFEISETNRSILDKEKSLKR